VHLARISIVGLVLAALVATLPGCVAQPTLAPTGSSASPIPSPSDPLADPVIKSVNLVWLTTAQTCSLLSAAEATTILGSSLQRSPGGISDPGDHAQCVYEAATGMVEGTYIKIEINRIGFAGEAELVNLHRGAHTLKVAGFEAIGADAETDPVNEEAVLSVKLAKDVADPALWIQAPTSAVAQKAADLILPRLAALP